MRQLHIFFLIVISAVSCGKPQSQIQSQKSKSTLNWYCFNPVNSLRGCCSSNGGVQKCSEYEYQFNLDMHPICKDGSVSQSCVGKR